MFSELRGALREVDNIIPLVAHQDSHLPSSDHFLKVGGTELVIAVLTASTTASPTAQQPNQMSDLSGGVCFAGRRHPGNLPGGGHSVGAAAAVHQTLPRAVLRGRLAIDARNDGSLQCFQLVRSHLH